MSPAGTDRVVLVGMMGSGKTTVGAILAERLGWPFHDNDSMLRTLFGANPRELLEAGGEAAMHSAEVTALLAALARPTPSVLAAAGGTIVDAAARSEMAAAGLVVWLRVTAETVEERSAGGAHRPWPAGDRTGWIERAVREREGLYAEVADVILDADTAAPAALADRIMDKIEQEPA